MKKAEYKNSIQSKKKITSTYLTLLIEKGDKFTVTDLVKRAGINRGTFYLHFKNLQDVSVYIENELAENFQEIEINFRQYDIDRSPEIILDKLNDILNKDLKYYKLFLTASDNNQLLEKIKKSILKLISNNFMVMKYVTNYENFKIVVQYIVGGVVNTYADWFKGNIDCELKDMSSFLANMIRSGLKGIITYNAY